MWAPAHVAGEGSELGAYRAFRWGSSLCKQGQELRQMELWRAPNTIIHGVCPQDTSHMHTHTTHRCTQPHASAHTHIHLHIAHANVQTPGAHTHHAFYMCAACTHTHIPHNVHVYAQPHSQAELCTMCIYTIHVTHRCTQSIHTDIHVHTLL